MEKIIKALKSIRINPIEDEYILHDVVAQTLADAGIKFIKEYKLGNRSRVDFFTENGVAIEIKKGKPYSRTVIEQLKKYSQFDEVRGIILVIEKNMDIPLAMNGKPCLSIGLNKLWGIAL